MDVLFFNDTPHVHPAVRTQTCQGCSSVPFTATSLETPKNKRQTDWPHFPASEQRNTPLLLPEQMAEAKLNCAYVIIRMSTFLMGKAIHGPAVHIALSSQLEFARHRQNTVLFWGESENNDLARRVWI